MSALQDFETSGTQVIYLSKLNAALLAGVALAVVSHVQDAAAQQSGDATTLDQIDVQGRGQGGSGGGKGSGTAPVEGYVATATTTGSKTDTPIKLIPQSIGVVGRQQMDDLGANKPDEAVRYSAGVFAHASRHGSRHATAWGVAAFLLAGVAVPVYFIRHWARGRRR